jgi:hypothetical protein
METAWSHREPDRVPIELEIPSALRKHPKGQRLCELADQHATNFGWAPGPHWGFLGIPTEHSEETIEDVPGQYRRVRRVHKTPVGEFTAVTHHPAGNPDYHWEKRYIDTLDDMSRLAHAPRIPANFDAEAFRKAATESKGVPLTGLLHPLGYLVRSSCMENVYGWFASEPQLIHHYLEAANRQVIETVRAMGRAGLKPNFAMWAHEMLIPPWMGHRHFDELVVPYDRAVNETIHAIGGRLRIHSHGNCMDFLEKMADMGVDAIEPLEPPPAANCDLSEAKRRVGRRLLLSGNILSQQFYYRTPAQVREEVREAIQAAAPGGGFSLRTTGGICVGAIAMTREQEEREIAAYEAYLLAGLEFGQYPIRV